ncbi:ropporin-1-like protein [Anoplolepis gracilipes]|uniref:ropporin-1-like protein n=1 Tax=Anoplolepis gracilipes TaxID=354296 RepID=UPI003BA14AAC
MSFVEQPVFGREIAVPAKLPTILKQFCKAAIRTQPRDLLKWSGSYFRALADGDEPPVKSRLEYPPPSTASGLTLGFLRVLLRQFGNYNKTLPIETVLHHWDCLCLDRKDFDAIITIGKFRRTCQVKKFLAITVGLLGATLTETMIMICQLFTHEPDGGSAMIPLTLFMDLYEYLAGLACDGSEKNATCDQDVTDRTCSMNSQDTDVDVNLDSELISKDEIASSKSMNYQFCLPLFCQFNLSIPFFRSRLVNRTNGK